MSLRIDSGEWISGALLIGETGLGVLGDDIPATGDSGASYLYNDMSLPADAAKEICGRITAWPASGTLVAYEDGSFEFSGASDDAYSFSYQLYVDGVATGSPVEVDLVVGSSTDALAAQPITTAAPTISQPTLSAASSFDDLIAQSISTGAITVQQATLAQYHALSAQGIDTAAPSITQPTMGQIHTLAAQSISSAAPSISTPTLTAAADFDNLAAQDITTSAPTLTSPTLGQVHALAAGAVAAGVPTISAPSLGQIHVLLGQGLATGAPTVGLATLGEPGLAVWPLLGQVLAGVVYGPTGVEYTGTYAGTSGPSAAEIAAAVRADLTAELAQLTKVSKIHGIGVPLVVSPTTRTAGDLVQTITTVGDTTTVSAA